MFYIRKTIYLRPVKSNLNNKIYDVRDLVDKQEAADLLANIEKNIVIILKSVDKSMDFKTKLTENIPGSLYVAYTVNKGDELNICLRNKDESFIDINTIMFVVIHELAHIITPETGHTENFWKNMRKLLDKAIELGLYYDVDYSLEPTNYCGMDINSSP